MERITQIERILKEVVACCTGVDTGDALKIDDLFKKISESDKNLVLGYLSALADKAVVDKGKQLQEA